MSENVSDEKFIEKGRCIMKTNNKKKTSSKRKLAPAIAMLTTSAVMLTTATYAWFTIGKEAQVTGLEMSATAGGGLEISLGQIGNSEGTVLTAPGMSEQTLWKSNVSVADYYSAVGKLNPASTVNGNNLFKVTSGVNEQGKKLDADAKVEAVEATSDEASLELRSSIGSGEPANTSTDGTKEGYYVDVPMWMRSTSTTAQKVKCAVTIKNTETNAGTELKNAVRVAVIPISKAQSAKTDGTSPTIDKAASYTASPEAVFGLKADSYGGGTSAYGLSATNTTTSAVNKFVGADSGDTTTASDIFTLEAAANTSDYSVQGFVVRVWLEGESTSCWDQNAGQDWNISLKFTAEDNA